MFLTFIVLFNLILLAFVIRNAKVYDYRMKLLDRVSDVARRDIDAGILDWRWRYEELEDVEYFKHVLQFWKPIDSFYPRDPARIER